MIFENDQLEVWLMVYGRFRMTDLSERLDFEKFLFYHRTAFAFLLDYYHHDSSLYTFHFGNMSSWEKKF